VNDPRESQTPRMVNVSRLATSARRVSGIFKIRRSQFCNSFLLDSSATISVWLRDSSPQILPPIQRLS
jgi:hypothetical protein